MANDLEATFSEALKGMAEIERISEKDIPAITESVFKSRLLPVLVSKGHNHDLSVWLELAGHPQNHIRVTSDDRRQVLFEVPPLARTIVPDVAGPGRLSMTETVEEALQRHSVMPQMGDAHIRQRLVDNYRTHPIEVRHVQQLNAILVRYGHPPLTSMTDVGSKEDTTPAGSSPLFDEEYDDF